MNSRMKNMDGKKKQKKYFYDIDLFIKKNELQNQVLEKIIKKINQSQSPKNEEKIISNLNLDKNQYKK